MTKQISTAVDELVHSAFLLKASAEGITPYNLLKRLIHEHLGIVDSKGAVFEARVSEVVKHLESVKIGESVDLNKVSEGLPFKASEWEIRSALMRSFLTQPDGSWKRIADKDGKIPAKSKFYAAVQAIKDAKNG